MRKEIAGAMMKDAMKAEQAMEIRAQVDSLDDRIRELLKERAEVVSGLLGYKLATGQAIFQANREQLMLERMEEMLTEEGVAATEIRMYKTTLERLIAASRELQYRELYKRYVSAYVEEGVPVDYPFLSLLNGTEPLPGKEELRAFMKEHYPFPLGKKIASGMRRDAYRTQRVAIHAETGVNSQAIVREIWPEAQIHKETQLGEVLQDVADGTVDVGLLTVREGEQYAPPDLTYRLQDFDLHVAERFTVKRKYCLMHHPETAVSEIRGVVSESRLLERIAPQIRRLGWQMRSVGSTDEAARELRVCEDKSSAVLLSETEGKSYGLVTEEDWEVFSFELEVVFAAVTKELHISQDAEKIILTFTLSNRTGNIASAIQAIADYGFDIVEIGSVVEPDQPYRYRTYLEFKARPNDEGTFPLLYQASVESLDTEIVGWIRDTVL